MRYKKADVFIIGDDKNEYNEPVGEIHLKSIDIFITLVSHKSVNDIRFIDTTHTGLTSDKTITDKMIIEQDGIKYKVNFVNIEPRLAQLELKKYAH